jgi:hypothetical protein
MPFPKLQVDRHLMSWNQMIDMLKVVSAHNRPKLWAIANLLGGLDEGMTREEYAVGFCIGGRQLRRWIHRFNCRKGSVCQQARSNLIAAYGRSTRFGRLRTSAAIAATNPFIPIFPQFKS